MFKLIVPPKVLKQISKIDKRYQRAIKNAIDSLVSSPLAGKKLDPPFNHLRSLRIGVYRIIYQVIQNELIIYLVSVSHRKEVYKRL